VLALRGVVGEDVVAHQDRAFAKKGLNLKVTALINDTVGTMLSGCYQEVGASCFCGVILGTGANCCYLEKIANITKYTPTDKERGGSMIVNLECGNFGSRSDRIGRDIPLTEFDIELDNNSNNKTHQVLEKQMSGMYLGELTGLILAKYIKAGLIFKTTTGFNAKDFTTEFMSKIEADVSSDLSVVSEVLAKVKLPNSTLEERKFVKSASHLVGRRAGQLAAVQIAAIYKQFTSSSSSSSLQPLVAAVDGSVFEKYPNFPEIMAETLTTLLGPNKVKLVLAKDGSGNGAALASVAAF